MHTHTDSPTLLPNFLGARQLVPGPSWAPSPIAFSVPLSILRVVCLPRHQATIQHVIVCRFEAHAHQFSLTRSFILFIRFGYSFFQSRVHSLWSLHLPPARARRAGRGILARSR